MLRKQKMTLCSHKLACVFSVIGFFLIGDLFAMSSSPDKHAFSTQAFSSNNLAVIKPSQTSTLHQILRKEQNARAILVGEMHTRFDHHLIQLETIKFFKDTNKKLTIGVEWFQRPFQKYLDDFIAGKISEGEMLHKTEYFSRWRYDYRLYRPILLYAREHGIRIIALNTTRELLRALMKSDVDELPADLKSQVPRSYDWSDKDYENRLLSVFNQHPEYPGKFEDFLRSQLTWDESMAESAADYLNENPGTRMLIFAGSGHISYGSGIPNRIKRRLDGKVVTVLVSDEHTQITPNLSDYLVFSAEQALPAAGILGAYLDDGEDTVAIKALSENSALTDSDIKPGSIIVGIDETMISNLAEFKLAMLKKKPGEEIELHYRQPDSEKSNSIMVILK